MSRRYVSSSLLLLLCVEGCMVGPNYKRPPMTVPDQYRGAPAASSTNASAAATASATFADMNLAAVFPDATLQDLLKEALTNNYDIRIAAARVMEAAALVGITRANELPQVNLGGAIQNQRTQPTANITSGTAAIEASWVLDFWGQYRRATESARANLLASQYAQAVVRTTLITSVANAYFQLREYDSQLDTSQQTLVADREILRINTIMVQGGESAITDQLQAELLVQQAEAQIISLRQGIEQTENQISILLGRNPGPVGRGLRLDSEPHEPTVPTGLPSALLERRPDVRQAEELLVAANANVGVAKAAFFPQFSLTGAFGVQSTALTSFLGGGPTTAAWTLLGQAAQPIYQGGRITAAYRLALAQRDEAELTYKKTALGAFRDVSNALVAYEQSRLYRMKLQEQTGTYKEAARLANVRFQGGYTAFLEVLVTQQQYFASELVLDQAWTTELQNYAALFQALGGGWQP
jgi:outer membrane protein, multidrug efflux system